jgi:hypothetical protein
MAWVAVVKTTAPISLIGLSAQFPVDLHVATINTALASPVRTDTASSLKEKTWNPPTQLANALDAVWKHETANYSPKPNPLLFPNFGFNQVIANKGHINFCVRWDPSKTATPEIRKKIDEVLKVQTKKWMDIFVGFDGWPYTEVPVKVTGWAARNHSLLPGYNNATEGFRFYTNKDREGRPQCSESCGRFFHQNGDYSKCPDGPAIHYDMSLWLTDGFRGGAVSFFIPQ